MWVAGFLGIGEDFLNYLLVWDLVSWFVIILVHICSFANSPFSRITISIVKQLHINAFQNFSCVLHHPVANSCHECLSLNVAYC